MNDKALVSIALCTYNGEAYLREQLDSIVNQSYPAIELIAVDDCS
ncbi:MAG TPA: glycosyltransferase, partial [Daejeonella sp.]|nr:glycosyltransferase [Daejeonella sp.]